MLEIEDDTINISPINWLGDILLAESIEYKNDINYIGHRNVIITAFLFY